MDVIFLASTKIHLELNVMNLTLYNKLYNFAAKPSVTQLVKMMLPKLQTDTIEKGQEGPP